MLLQVRRSLDAANTAWVSASAPETPHGESRRSVDERKVTVLAGDDWASVLCSCPRQAQAPWPAGSRGKRGCLVDPRRGARAHEPRLRDPDSRRNRGPHTGSRSPHKRRQGPARRGAGAVLMDHHCQAVGTSAGLARGRLPPRRGRVVVCRDAVGSPHCACPRRSEGFREQAADYDLCCTVPVQSHGQMTDKRSRGRSPSSGDRPLTCTDIGRGGGI